MRIKNFSEFINEKAISIKDILRDETQQGLVFNKWSRHGTSYVSVMLYDFDDETVLGYIEMSRAKGDEYFQVSRSAAEKGYGPDMYDFAMMLVSPNGVRPDNVIRPAAQNVWKYYSSSRPDVKKEEIKKDSSEYIDSFEIDREHPKQSDSDVLKMINTAYFLDQTEDFKELINRGYQYLGKYDIGLSDVMKMKDSYFKSKYYQAA